MSSLVRSSASGALGNRLLDFGGYNVFTAYGLTAVFPDLQITVADLDPKCLHMSSALSMQTVDLPSQTLCDQSSFDICVSLHCLEHLERPKDALTSIKAAVKVTEACYFEAPNAYGFPIGDPAHLVSFDIHSFSALVESAGFRILNRGYAATPIESLDFDYYSNSQENIFVVCTPVENGETSSIRSQTQSISLTQMQFKFVWAGIRLSFISLKTHSSTFTSVGRNLVRSVLRAIASPLFIITVDSFRFVHNIVRH